ncbi:LysR substrate-binding domain-containing protein [Coralliovum pocilloporae]|uniref:LysR substrate-binding domain-containing protein n=1 Tax=Coralliovum pocilloporae TaxID=3066369 RepID=UPI00330747AD
MRYALPPLPALQAFEAAARHENFVAAAEELNLSHSAVSQRVRQLEQNLGYPLFERLPRGLRLTESGKAYLPSVRKAFDEILGSTSAIFGPRSQGFLTIRMPISYSSLWLTTVIDDFISLYPNIELRITSSVWADKLANDDVDIDIRLGYGFWPGYRSYLVYRDQVIVVCSPSTLKALPDHPTVADLLDHPLIHVMGIEDLWEKYFTSQDLTFNPQRHMIRVDSSTTGAELAANSNRFTLMQTRLLKPYIESGRLVMPFDHKASTDQALYLLEKEAQKKPKPEAILFRDWLFETFRDADQDRLYSP